MLYISSSFCFGSTVQIFRPFFLPSVFPKASKYGNLLPLINLCLHYSGLLGTFLSNLHELSVLLVPILLYSVEFVCTTNHNSGELTVWSEPASSVWFKANWLTFWNGWCLDLMSPPRPVGISWIALQKHRCSISCRLPRARMLGCWHGRGRNISRRSGAALLCAAVPQHLSNLVIKWQKQGARIYSWLHCTQVGAQLLCKSTHTPCCIVVSGAVVSSHVA